MALLFVNSLKGLFSKKIQIIAIILLIAIAITLYVSANIAIKQVKDGYYNHLSTQKVEHFSFVPNFDITEFKKEDLQLVATIELTEAEKAIIKQAEFCLDDNCQEQTLLLLYNIFVKYNQHLNLNIEKVSEFAKVNNFEYQLETSKVKVDGEKYYKAIPYDENKNINIPYLLEGRFPKSDNEITILPNYATTNELEIGDVYTINEIEYTIVGLAFLSDHIYPLISISVPLFNEEHNNIMLMNQNTYQNFVGVEEKIYAGRYLEEIDFRNRNIFEEDGIYDQEVISYNTISFLRFARTDAIQGDLEPNEIFTNVFVNVLLVIGSVMIVIIVKKRIESEKNQVGILKALGYGTIPISLSYLLYPIIGALIGSFIGYGAGLILAEPLTSVYVSYYNVPLQEHQITFEYINRVFLMPAAVLSFFSFITAYFMIKKPPLFLLKEGSHIKVNFLARFTNKILKNRPFKTRFKYSLAFRSIGKLAIVTIVSFSAGLLITLFMIGNGLFNHLIDQTFGNMNFDYVVSYNTFLTDGDEEADLFFNIDNSISKIVKEDQEIIPEEKIEVTLSGVDQDLKYLLIKDKDEKSLLSHLEENEVVISKRLAQLHEISENDLIVLTINNQDASLKVSAIYEEYFSGMVFVDRFYLSELYGFENAIFNQKYTNNEKYADTGNLDEVELSLLGGIISIKDLEENVMKEMAAFDYVIYVIIIFAAIMAFIIMLVIANVIVEENKKNISLMKVLGYKNKEIGVIILNIYTPFVIVAYLISVPVMVYLVKMLLKYVASDINIVIPVEISLVQTIIGLLAILFAYYLGIAVSRKALNRISLSEALKRE